MRTRLYSARKELRDVPLERCSPSRQEPGYVANSEGMCGVGIDALARQNYLWLESSRAGRILRPETSRSKIAAMPRHQVRDGFDSESFNLSSGIYKVPVRAPWVELDECQ